MKNPPTADLSKASRVDILNTVCLKTEERIRKNWGLSVTIPGFWFFLRSRWISGPEEIAQSLSETQIAVLSHSGA
jgi:hypothetical protein